MSAISPRLFVLQRATALLLAPLVIGHLIMIVIAIKGGLDSAEILGRTRGSILWALFYGLFVVAVAIHASIGVRVIASEWFDIRSEQSQRAVMWSTLIVLLSTGAYAVFAVTAS
ncbi:MAG: succinate dehydrogenase [Pseudomonadota bacterium]